MRNVMILVVSLAFSVPLLGDTWTDPETGIVWTYTVSDGMVSVGSGDVSRTAVPKSTIGALEIPSVINEYPVTSIGTNAFYSCSSLTSVIIPTSVTSIEKRAFESCDSLQSVVIPSSVVDIGDGAFSWCRALTTMTIPAGVRRIGNGVLSGCNDLVEIAVDEGNQYYMSEGGFLMTKDGKSLLAAVKGDLTIPSSVTSIDEIALSGYEGMTSVVIPSNVKDIGNSAFSGCLGLTNVVFSEGVTNIGDSAFYGCDGLKEVSIPASVRSIGCQAFDIWGLMSVTIQDGTTVVDGGAFSYDRLRSVTIMSGDVIIEGFRSFENLTDVTFGKEVTSIAGRGFESCGNLTNVVIPEGVTNIGEHVFAGCGLSSVTIPSSVTSIGEGAFYGCPFEDGVVISDGVTHIGVCAFSGCGFSSVTIPSSVTSIDEGAFECCSFTDGIVFKGEPPSGLKEAMINEDTHIRYNAAYEAEWLPVIEACGFTNASPCDPETGDALPDGVMVEVVDGVVWYYSHPSVSSYTGGVTYPDEAMVGAGLSYYEVHVNAISTNTIGKVAIPSVLGGWPVTTIASRAFKGCKGVTAIEIPASVQYIGTSAFEGCGSLLSVTFKGDVPSTIGSDIFSGTPMRLVVSVPYGSIGWNGSVTTPLPESWNGRAIVHAGESYDWDAGHGSGSGGQPAVQTTVVIITNIVVHYIQTSELSSMAAPVTKDVGIVNVMTEVKGGNVSIPNSWVDNYPSFASRFGSDFSASLTKVTGKFDAAGSPMMVWQDFVAGTDPTDENSVFRASVTMVDGKPVVSYTPELSTEEKAKRKYTTYGKVKLQDAEWAEVSDGHESDYNFFKVTVEMK